MSLMSNVVETVFMCLLAINVIFLLLLKCLVWSYSNSDKKQVVLSRCQRLVCFRIQVLRLIHSTVNICTQFVVSGDFLRNLFLFNCTPPWPFMLPSSEHFHSHSLLPALTTPLSDALGHPGNTQDRITGSRKHL